jgi:molybdenum cofactor biosynthesis enzyme MoaA
MPDVPLWPQCNIGCVFCSNPVEDYRNTTAAYRYEAFVEKWEKFKRGDPTFLKFDGVRDYFNLTGGEPTLHPDFHRILAKIRLDYPGRRIKLLTNGRMLSYDDFARRTFGIAQLPFEVAVPVFGYDAKSHESISRTPGSFEETMAGLRNCFRLRRHGQRVEVRLILTRPQMRTLSGTVEFLAREFPDIDSLDLLFVELEGFAEKYGDRLMMTMSECGRALEPLAPLLSKFRQARLLHFPLCTLPTALWPFVWNTLDPIKVSWKDGCSDCLYRPQCVGVHKSYLKHVGAPDVSPILEPKAVSLTGDPYHPVSGAA